MNTPSVFPVTVAMAAADANDGSLMQKSSALQYLIMQKILARPGETAADAPALAAWAVRSWRNMAAYLTPVIGDRGMHALFVRSLQLTGPTFPWLVAAENADADSSFSSLEATLARRDTSEAIAATNVLFVTFIELLASLIGESLTEQLLHMAWQDMADAHALKACTSSGAVAQFREASEQ